MEKLSLDSDSPIRGDYKRDVDTHTPVRQTGRKPGIEGGVLGIHDIHRTDELLARKWENFLLSGIC